MSSFAYYNGLFGCFERKKKEKQTNFFIQEFCINALFADVSIEKLKRQMSAVRRESHVLQSDLDTMCSVAEEKQELEMKMQRFAVVIHNASFISIAECVFAHKV
jgi:hypothetical protein